MRCAISEPQESAPQRVSENWQTAGFSGSLSDMNEQKERKSYPTDLTDAEWQEIEPYLHFQTLSQIISPATGECFLNYHPPV